MSDRLRTLRFIHNLTRPTHLARANRHLRPSGFLIAPGNARGQLLSLTDDIARSRADLFVDNGNFATIGKIRQQFASEGAVLAAEVRQVEATIGRSIRRTDVSAGLALRYRRFAMAVRAECLRQGLRDDAMLATQLPLRPDAIVGSEDLTMASWLSLDVEPTVLPIRRRDYRRYNRSVARRAVIAQQRLAQLTGSGSLPHYYPVASAVSHNTAFDAGREFADAGLDNVAMGFGAYMADRNYVDHVVVGRRRIDLGANVPQRYLRTAVVAAGFWRGFSSVAGHGPARFHFLGLGAPAIIPIAAFAARSSTELTFDATSPMKDAAVNGMLYVDRPALLKVKTRRVAHRLAREPGHAWECPCPFCTAFVSKHPFDLELGRRWFRRTGASRVTAADLRPTGELFDAYPLLSEPAAGPMRSELNYTRTGHNHWILERLMTSLERAARRDTLDDRAGDLVSTYMRNTSAPYARALSAARELVGLD